MNLEPIDTNTTAGKIRVMQLADAGRQVVYFNHGTPHSGWRPRVANDWTWGACSYAILCEPKVVWVNESDWGHGRIGRAYDSESNANAYSEPTDSRVAVRYVEARQ